MGRARFSVAPRLMPIYRGVPGEMRCPIVASWNAIRHGRAGSHLATGVGIGWPFPTLQADSANGPAALERPGPGHGGHRSMPVTVSQRDARRLVKTGTPGIFKRGGSYVVVGRDLR